MAKTDYKSVADYIAAQPASARPVLRRVRAAIRGALPRAAEGISYQIPVYKLNGRTVLYFAGYARHYAIYPATTQLLGALRKQLAGRLHHKATLRFPMDAAVPSRLVARIAKLRAAEAMKPYRRKTARAKP